MTEPGFTWAEYLDGLVVAEGSLTAVAERLAAARAYEDDVGSIERALRRLRGRGLRPGGKWGTRLVAAYGLPAGLERRLRWMASYHSRFTDLPVEVCEDLIRLYDHPPVTEKREHRAWLALAHATVTLRRDDFDGAAARLAQARLDLGVAPIEAQAEALLVEAYIASRREPARVAELLAAVEPLLPRVADGAERACLHSRWIDQRAYRLNKDGEAAAAEALYRQIPEAGAPPFALCRRATGLAYARWRQGHRDEAIALARRSVSLAGDGGHVRLRAMALTLLARVEEDGAARGRAAEISRALEDETLRLRVSR